MNDRREFIQLVCSGSITVGLAGCIGDNSSKETQVTSQDQVVPHFGLESCSDSRPMQILEIDGSNAVIKNNDAYQRAFRITSWSNDDRIAPGTVYPNNPPVALDDEPITELYYVEAGSTTGVKLPTNRRESTKDTAEELPDVVSFPIDKLTITSARIDDDADLQDSLRLSGFLEPDNFKYDSDIHKMMF